MQYSIFQRYMSNWLLITDKTDASIWSKTEIQAAMSFTKK